MNIKSNPFGSCFQHEIVQMQFDISIFDIHVVRKKLNKHAILRFWQDGIPIEHVTFFSWEFKTQ